MIVRRATPRDLEAYLSIQKQEWGETMAATTAQLQSRLEVFPDGVLVGEAHGRVVAGATFLRLRHYRIEDQLSWADLTDRGWCTNHDPTGDVLFGVDMTVSRHGPRAASSLMFMAALELTVRLGADGLYWGSRLPRYHRYAERLSAEEYVVTRTPRGRLLDPELHLYLRVPGVELVGVVPGYFKDPDSADFGAVLRWPNPVRRHPYLRPLAGRVVAGLYLLDRHRNRRRQER